MNKDLDKKEIRVRIAPSPTGLLHIGTARAALFNYLFAKQKGGRFIVRIEDTDTERSTKEFENNILESFKWLGLEYDEGPDVNGEYGPYRQSEKIDIYAKYIQKLLDEDRAYHCFCTKEDLEAQRQYQMSIGNAPIYAGKCSSLSKEEQEKRLSKGESSVIRFRTKKEKVSFNDLIRGKIEFDSNLIGDIVIAKDLKNPLYNFAVVIDDYEMNISHVIRGEDHISNTPKQILIQEALGLPSPKFGHLPLILAPDRSKMSKRHGAVSVTSYREDGYLPEALINFMAFLGWNPGTDKEIYSIKELINDFSLERILKSGAIFNMKRLEFFNAYYIKQKSIKELTELCLPYFLKTGLIEKRNGTIVQETGEEISVETLEKIVSLYQERIKTLTEITDLTDYFFKSVIKYEKELLVWTDMSLMDIAEALNALEKIIINIENWTENNLEKILLSEAELFGTQIGKAGNRGCLLWPLRVALTGQKNSAGPFSIAVILGKEKTIKRIQEAKQLLN